MDVEKILYSDYIKLNDNEKYFFDFCLNYSKDKEKFSVKDYFSSTPIEERSFIFVKEANELLQNNDFENLYKHFANLPEYSNEIFYTSPAYKVILTLKYFITRLRELQQMENEILISKFPDSAVSNCIEQIDFSMFGTYYGEIRELAGNDITKFEEVKKLKYCDCFIELAYRTKLNDVERLVAKSMTAKH